jgi:hypothetical protein
MNAILKSELVKTCAICGIPLDAQHFDVSQIVDLQNKADTLRPGRSRVMAEFKLPAEYCGVLQHFFQFIQFNKRTHAADRARVDTPDFEWTIRVNGHPLHPYLGFRHIVNPWGYPCCPTAIRLDEGAVLDFVVRRVGASEQNVTKIGARLVGRYWYNTVYGNGL